MIATILDSFYDLKEWEALDDELKAIVNHAAEYEPYGVIPFSSS